jgi:RNA polymerase sigma-B factor
MNSAQLHRPPAETPGETASADTLPAIPRPRAEAGARAAPNTDTSLTDDGYSGYDDEYQHLQPLLDEYARTTPADPHRELLRDRLITGYLPVAQHIAWRYGQRGEPVEDLVQVATLGLIHAVDRYDPAHGRPFLAFAVPTVTGEVRRYFRDKTWAVRVPRRHKDLNQSINRVSRELFQELDRAPRPSEIAAQLDIGTEEVLDALAASRGYRADSLDEMFTAESDSTTLGDMFGQTDPEFEKFNDSHSLAPHLDALPARERSILLMRFYGEMTQSQIAERIGISQMHVSRLLAATLERLRQATLQSTATASSTSDRAVGPSSLASVNIAKHSVNNSEGRLGDLVSRGGAGQRPGPRQWRGTAHRDCL